MSSEILVPGRQELAVFRSLTEIPVQFGPAVAAIGNFDGVHLGHREILTHIVNEARVSGRRSVAITFDPHPEQLLRPADAPEILTPLPERIRLLAETGLDAVVILPFDLVLAKRSPLEFVQTILVDALKVVSLHEGRNFRFGHGAAAGIAELEQFGNRFGFTVHVHEPVRVRGLEVSSSAIRGLVASGDMRRSRWMLGRPFAIASPQARGRGIGSRLLVPTVNLAAYDGLLPAFGVYVTRLGVKNRIFQAVTNVGNRPTFGEASFAIESHILDFQPMDLDENDLVELAFLKRLRGEQTWPSPEALKAQIFKDVARAKRFFSLMGPR